MRGEERENPYRSLHWWGSQEAAMWDSGEWWETPYPHAPYMVPGASINCCATTSRRSTTACHHTHRVDEWTPYTAHGQHVCPSKEEAEYTAVLAYAIAVSASWWAARVGVAKLHVPRMPQFHTVGRREHWLDIDPRALREWAMVPLAVSLGLTAALQSRPGLPVRATVEAKQVAPDQLATGCIYVGRGSFHHRLQTTKWRSPWTPGHNCDTSEWLSLYVQHIRTSNLWEQLEELHSCTLVCDCPLTEMCEADVLVGLFFDATSPSTVPRASSRASWQRTVMLLQGIQSIPQAVALPMMSQETLVLAFRKLFPAAWFDNYYQFAMVEDLINAPSAGYSSPPTTAAGSLTTTPQRATQSEGTPADAIGEVSASPPEVSAFPFASMAAPLSLAEALSSSLSSPVPPTPLSLAKTLAGEAASPAVPTAPWPPQVFSMTLRKADGAELGLNVKALDSQKVVLVEGIRADGAVEAWNRPRNAGILWVLMGFIVGFSGYKTMKFWI
eukprot:s950_g11.t1